MESNNDEQLLIHKSDFGKGEARWITLGDPLNNDLLFYAANGFTAASYQFFLERFAYRITALDNRGAWPERRSANGVGWQHHADDLIAFMRSRFDLPPIAMGHSLGAGVCVLAAVRQPQLFKRLVLIEPATTPFQFVEYIPDCLMNQIPIIKSTLSRTNGWPDRASFGDYLRSKSAFKQFTDEAINDYASGGLIEVDGEFKLAYSPAWEAQNFRSARFVWRLLADIKLPVLLLRAEHSYLYSAKRFERMTKKLPANINCQTIPGVGHLAAQENPELVAQLVQDWLAS